MRFYLAHDEETTKLFKVKPRKVNNRFVASDGEQCNLDVGSINHFFGLTVGEVVALSIAVEKYEDELVSQRRRVPPKMKKELVLKYYDSGMKVVDITKALRVTGPVIHEMLREAGYVCQGPGKRWTKPKTLMEIFKDEERKHGEAD